jgi:DeoR/GlpR family transcriptional regulator of sugar metabolism
VNNERQALILELIEKKGEVGLQELKEMFPNVSAMTLRRDLISFENEGLVVRTYGGAISIKKLPNLNGEEDPYYRRMSENIEAKLEISRKAINLVERGRSIYLDAGSTTMCLAEKMPDENFSIITSGINIGLELMKKQKLSVITLGGLVNRNTLSVSGPNAASFLDNINIDLAFMSASGFSLESGFTISNIYECELKRKVIQSAKKVIMLMDSSKINKNLPFTFSKLEDVDIWITEKEFPADIRDRALKSDVQLI